MPMNASTLGSALAAAVGTSDPAAVEKWNDVAAEIVNHIKNNATVSVTVSVTTTGSAVSQAGGGSGSGTIS